MMWTMQPKRIQSAFFLGVLLLTTLLFLWLIRAFLQPLFWAAVLAIVFNPLHRLWLRVARNRRSAAAGLALLSIVLIVLIPLFLVGYSLSVEAVGLYQRIVAGEIDLGRPLRWLEQAPVLKDWFARFGLNREDLVGKASEAALTLTRVLASQAVIVGQSTLHFVLNLAIMLYLLFFFLRDGHTLIERLIQSLPLGDARERKLFGKFATVARATIKGTFVVAIGQGTIGGVLFWITGIHSPVFWGVVMTITSVIPAVGTVIVWLPAAIYLLLTGAIWQGVLVLVGGSLVISVVDNVLRPILVGKDTQMPDALILLSTLGGITVFGVSGFVIGPIVAAFFVAVWEMFAEEYAQAIETGGLR